MQLKNSLKSINYRLFLALLLMGLIPTIYTTVRIFFLGQMPGDWGFNIASQLSWLNVIYEIIQEALILPLFYFMGQALANQQEFQNRVKTGMLLTFIIYTILAIIIIGTALDSLLTYGLFIWLLKKKKISILQAKSLA